MALRRKVIDFVWLRLLDDTDETGAVRHVTVVKKEADSLFVAILVKMVDAICVEEACAALDAVNDVALVEQEFGKLSAVLAGDAGNEGDFGLFCHAAVLHVCAAWLLRKSW